MFRNLMVLTLIATLATGCTAGFSFHTTPGPEMARMLDTRPHVTILANVAGADYGVVSTEYGVLGKILPGQQYSFPLNGQTMSCPQQASYGRTARYSQPAPCTPVGSSVNVFVQWYKNGTDGVEAATPERVGCSMKQFYIPGGNMQQAVTPWSIAKISPPGQTCSS